MMDDTNLRLELMFKYIDKAGRGFVDGPMLAEACNLDLTPKELEELVNELDRDKDGKITMEDFKKGYNFIGRRGSNAMTTKQEGRQRLSSVEQAIASEVEDQFSAVEDVQTCQKALRRAPLRTRSKSRMREDRKTKYASRTLTQAEVKTMEKKLDGLKCKTELLDIYKSLKSENPSVFYLYEKILEDLAVQVKNHDLERENMDIEIQRIRDQHNDDLARLAKELDHQIAAAEESARFDGRRNAEAEFEMQISMRDSEIEELQLKVENLEKQCVNSGQSSGSGTDEVGDRNLPEGYRNRGLSRRGTNSAFQLAELRQQLSQMTQDKRTAELELATLRTQFLLTKTSISTLKQSIEEKNRDIESYRASTNDLLKESNQLKQQVNLLQEVNLRLYDANDDLRATLDQSDRPVRNTANVLLQHHGDVNTAASLMSRADFDDHMKSIDAINATSALPHSKTDPINGQNVLLQQTNRVPCKNSKKPPMKANVQQVPMTQFPQGDPDSFYEDSGMSNSLRGITDLESEMDTENLQPRCVPNVVKANQQFVDQSQALYQQGAVNNKVERVNMYSEQLEGSDIDSDYSDISISSFHRKTLLRESGDQLSRSHKIDQVGSIEVRQKTEQESQETIQDETQSTQYMKDRDGEEDSAQVQELTSNAYQAVVQSLPEKVQVFKVMLAGDAAVGKSCFVIRLCTNVFKAQTMSTISVDVKTVRLDVEGRTVVLQLWDTAGQERFHSLSAAFYRKADGVLLLYDCTHEKSFLNVRHWMDTIDEHAHGSIPLMLIGNKIDLRSKFKAEGRRTVSYDEGRRLAQECNVCFIETSAKDGKNIKNCAVELAKLLKAAEDADIKETTVNLQPATTINPIRKSPCCDF